MKLTDNKWIPSSHIFSKSFWESSTHTHTHTGNTDAAQLCLCFSGCCKVHHITMEMRGANGGSCRHDTPAQNSLLLLLEDTEEAFSILCSPFSLPLLKFATLFSLIPSACVSLSLTATVWCSHFQYKHQPHPHTYLNDLWPRLKSHIFLYVPETMNKLTHTHTHRHNSYPTMPP